MLKISLSKATVVKGIIQRQNTKLIQFCTYNYKLHYNFQRCNNSQWPKVNYAKTPARHCVTIQLLLNPYVPIPCNTSLIRK